MARRAREQRDLFTRGVAAVPMPPLAERMRPTTLDEFVGQAHLLGPGRLLRTMIEAQRLHSVILWGPPGSGKTSLARVIASSVSAHCLYFSAVMSGVKDLRVAIDEARAQRTLHGRQSILFVDEIHRFNKAQQDAFLPYVEDGTIVLMGATTENPSFELNGPLRSRTSVLVLEPLGADEIRTVLQRALADASRGLGEKGLTIEPSALDFLVARSEGDARCALNVLEASADLATCYSATTVTLAVVEEASQRQALRYDKSGEEHYTVISAFIKSLRGSDPDAALYWMMRMLDAGEDPLFVARRMIIFAAEDIGTADPQALGIAVAVKDAFYFVGLPEGRIPLAQAAVYLAAAPKSNASYTAMLAAAADVTEHGSLPVPLHLRNAPTALHRELGCGRGYQYAHDQEGHVVRHPHLPDLLLGRRYFFPSENGAEAAIAERLARFARHRQTEPNNKKS